MGKYSKEDKGTAAGTEVPLQTAAGAEPADKKGKGKFTNAAAIVSGTGAYVPSFEKVQAYPNRIVAATMAPQKRGKTRFGFSMLKGAAKTAKLAYLQLDNNYQHALTAARKEYGTDRIQHLSYSSGDPRGDIQADARRRWERFVQDYDFCVRKFQFVMVDTMTELNDLRKLAEFGKTTQIMQLFYGSLYADYRWMVKHALDNDASVLFLHRMKDEYKNNERTGNLKLDGWPGIAYETQMLLEHTRDEDGIFSTIIREAGQDARLIGMEFTSDAKSENNDFNSLAAVVESMA